MPTEREKPTDTSMVQVRYRIIIGFLAVASVICAFMIYLFQVGMKRDALRTKIHSEYCQSRGWNVYTSFTLKCVDKDGIERLIPDSVWDPLK